MSICNFFIFCFAFELGENKDISNKLIFFLTSVLSTKDVWNIPDLLFSGNKDEALTETEVSKVVALDQLTN